MTDERYEKLRQREIWLVQQLKHIQDRAIEESKPLAEELWNLRDHRDGRTFTMPDGRTYFFTGPKTPYQLPEEKEQRA